MNRNLAIQSCVRAILLVTGLAALSLPAWASVVSPGVQALRVVAAKMTRSGAEALPPALRPVLYRSLTTDAGVAYNVNPNGCITLPRQSLAACFNRSGVRFTGAGSLALHLVSYGRGEMLSPVKAVEPVIKANRVSYAHDNLTEWWRVLPNGFEQGFTIAKRPSGNGELMLALAASRQDAGAPKKGTLAWGRLRYGELVVTDARGKVVPATLKMQDHRILIAVNDAHAVYPLTVDPLVWIEQEVTASDGQADDSYGFAVLVSGNRAFVGAPAPVSRPGSVYVFTRVNGVWSEVQKLMATPAEAPPPNWSDFFGYSLALSGDTLLIGAPETFDSQYGPLIGAAYVFTESGGTWAQQQELKPDLGPSDCSSLCFLGDAVALAGDTAVIGGYGYDGTEGTVYIYGNSGGTWSETQQLTASDGAPGDDHEFGYAVAFDGTNLLIGAPGPDWTSNNVYPQGAVYAFTKSDGSWAQTQKFMAGDGVDGDQFGFALSLTGTALLVGAPHANIASNTQQGAAYVFDGSSGTWTQTQKLTASDGLPYDQLGESVAIQDDTALVGEWSFDDNPNSPPPPPKKGEAYLFTASNGSWNQDKIFMASDGTLGDSFGWAVAVNGSTLLIGADAATINGNQYQGAAYFYGESDLGLSMSAPQIVGQGQQYVSQTIATNSSSAASPAMSATITVPAAASFISATATQGSCSETSGVVTCDFGQIPGNAGTATANVILKATGSSGTTIYNTASISKATPALTASAPTQITSSQSCPAGYTTYSGTLAANAGVRGPSYEAPAGEENAILYAQAGFKLYARVDNSEWGGQRQQGFPGTEVHRWGPAGTYAWGVKAGATGGAFTFCVMHP